METTSETTHITFKERKTAEIFLHQLNNNSLPGVEGTLKVTWVPNSTPNLTNATTTTTTTTTTGDAVKAGSEKQIGHISRGGDGADDADDDMLEDGEVVEDEGKREMDYEVADENEWAS